MPSDNIYNNNVSFTPATLAEFKRAYVAALAAHAQDARPYDASFIFDGHEWIIGYAKYAIQYLEERFKV